MIGIAPDTSDKLTARLYKYHEELKVRDGRAKGREEGRAEVSQLPRPGTSRFSS